MKKVLLLTDYYYPNPTSIGVCVDSVVDVLIEKGYNVDLICFGSNNCMEPIIIKQGIRVFFVKDRLWERIWKKNGSTFHLIGSIICRTSQLFMIHWFPMTSVTVPLRYYCIAKKIYENNKYDFIVSSYAPFEATYAAYKINKNGTPWVMYVLDTFSNRGRSKLFSRKWNETHGWRWERKFFSSASRIIVMKCHESHHQKSRYDFCRNKLFFSDIPLYNPNKYNGVKDITHDTSLRFVYTGRIDSHWYSPKEICDLFCHLSDKKNWTLHFFGRPTDCDKYLDDMSEKTAGKIVKEGFVSRERVMEEIKNADVLVSCCHSDSEMIQSKIFDYMSSGNKIIHITRKGLRDSAVDYYSDYPNAFIINIEDFDNVDIINHLVNFLESEIKIGYYELHNLFPSNRPENTASLIESTTCE